ncbi:rRNA processing/ribosome biogenesis-domain-containing protein [Podospora fimiseda]|uniref:Pre-rRNA-processing protein RIX1 n=1 Tax=Podospora fimiseda TaxID=252190 RepID=A0AAN7BZY8_9PEZI|nr:rRNA processing/ribosome biogenesis-domain-containing protein [Podospora fimiseda]
MAAAAPPDLRVLCRRLTSTPVDDLPRLCPLLVNHVKQCGAPLSASADAAKGKGKTSEVPVLVHKLRTHITTLLTGKSPSGRFAAVCLVKAVVDVGGWESLRQAEPWIRGLIAIVQKNDPFASKELAIITLTKIYMLLQGYQTLIREMATPTLPSFVTACLQLIKPSASGEPLKTPTSIIETVASSLSKLVVLYPTTLRPFATQTRTALRAYIAPTSSDSQIVPETLSESSRQLFILLSYTAPKNGSSDEWAKSIKAAILDSQSTADQIFRGVIESWESTTGYTPQQARTDGLPNGGGDSPDEFPAWSGIQAGSERLSGLLDFLYSYLDNPTKAPVSVPLGELLDLTSRLTLVTPPSPSSPEDSIQTNPAISRDEKYELWTSLPSIHSSVLRLHTSILRRLSDSAIPLATDIIDQTIRVFTPSPSIRETVYTLFEPLLLLTGPTLPRLTVDSLNSLIQSVCHDILLSTGHITSSESSTQTNNADAFLSKPPSSETQPTSLFPPLPLSHLKAAQTLLPLLLSHLPQSHLSPELRGLLDRTAILSNSKQAMLASCLHPYKDSRGRYYPSILPFLIRQYGKDKDVELVRSNLVKVQQKQIGEDWDASEGLQQLLLNGSKKEDEEMAVVKEEAVVVEEKKKVTSGWGDVKPAEEEKMEVDSEPVNAFAVTVTKEEEKREATPRETRAAAALKRKSETFEADAKKPAAKRVATKKIVEKKVEVAKIEEKKDADEDDSDSEGSVQIDMSLDDSEDEEEEDEE